MKKIIFLIILTSIGLNIYANPIALPTVKISELYFDDFDNWKLELGYFNFNEIIGWTVDIDSVFLYSTSDTVKLPKYNFIDREGVFVITKDSLGSDFIIKRYADTIKIVFYMAGYKYDDELIFGNIPGAVINYPRKGQSISASGWHCINKVKDNSPTIGLINDTLGVCGTLRGIVYDKYLKPVKRCKFWLDFGFETSENGEYISRVYSKPSQFKRIHLYNEQNQMASITEMKYVMEPDSIIDMNIYLLDPIISGIDESSYDKSPVQILPNPVSTNSYLNVMVDLPVITSNIWLEMFDINGKLIKKEKIRQKNNLIDTPSQEGSYLLNISLDNQIVFSKKIVTKK